MNLKGKLICNTYKYNNNGNLERVGVIDNIIGLTAEMKYGDFGTMTITMPYSTSQMYAAENADFITVNILSRAHTAYIIKDIERQHRSSGDTVKITCDELKSLTGRRVEYNAVDYSGLRADEAIKAIIDNNIINPAINNRKIQGYWNADIPQITGDYTAPKQFDVCSQSLRTICSELACNYSANVATIVNTTNSTIIWYIQMPLDRTASQTKRTPLLLSLDRDTVNEATINFAKHSLATTAVCAYGAEGNRQRTTYEPITKQGVHRYEIFVEGGSDANSTAAKEKGQEALAEYSDDTTITLKASTHLLERLFEDYTLGDIGTFIGSGINKDVQLTAIRFTFENSNISAEYTFGQDKKSIRDALTRLLQNSRNKK